MKGSHTDSTYTNGLCILYLWHILSITLQRLYPFLTGKYSVTIICSSNIKHLEDI